MEMREANDVTDEGFGSFSLLGMIHSGCVTFVTGWRSPSSMSRDAILSKKLERPHGSIERARRHSGDKGGDDG
jgi:hypothetical protein